MFEQHHKHHTIGDTTTLPPNALDFYRREGYIVVSGLLDATWVSKAQECLKELMTRFSSMNLSEFPANGRLVKDGAEWVIPSAKATGDSERERILKRVAWAGGAVPELVSLGRDDRILTVVAQLLRTPAWQGTSVDHLINSVHFKNPGDGVKFEWHQDIRSRKNYKSGVDVGWVDVNEQGSFVNAITAIDRVTLTNGPISIVPNSALPPHRRDVDLNLTGEEGIESVVFRPVARTIEMMPGDTIFFGPYVVHGSDANTSQDSRWTVLNGFSCQGANRRNYVGNGAAETIPLPLSAFNLPRRDEIQ